MELYTNNPNNIIHLKLNKKGFYLDVLKFKTVFKISALEAFNEILRLTHINLTVLDYQLKNKENHEIKHNFKRRI